MFFLERRRSRVQQRIPHLAGDWALWKLVGFSEFFETKNKSYGQGDSTVLAGDNQEGRTGRRGVSGDLSVRRNEEVRKNASNNKGRDNARSESTQTKLGWTPDESLRVAINIFLMRLCEIPLFARDDTKL